MCEQITCAGGERGGRERVGKLDPGTHVDDLSEIRAIRAVSSDGSAREIARVQPIDIAAQAVDEASQIAGARLEEARICECDARLGEQVDRGASACRIAAKRAHVGERGYGHDGRPRVLGSSQPCSAG